MDFQYVCIGKNRYDVYFEDEHIGILDTSNYTFKLESFTKSIFEADEIIDNFKYKLERFGSVAGKPLTIFRGDIDKNKKIYEELLEEILKIRAFRSNKLDANFDNHVSKILTWLDSTDFYQAPASTVYHESHPGGLCYHSLKVYNEMLNLHQLDKFKNVRFDSIALCCLVHDWCKIGLYESYKKNVKDESTGKWNQVDAYRRGKFPHPLGHGAASMYIASRFFKLTEEEALALRWHMSMFNVCDSEINEYQQACEAFPMVHLLQFADQLAITEY